MTCAERTDPRRSILGRRQRRWLLGGLDRSQGRCTIRPDRWHTDVRVVDSIPRRDAGVRTLARFLVEDGRPGSHRVD